MSKISSEYEYFHTNRPTQKSFWGRDSAPLLCQPSLVFQRESETTHMSALTTNIITQRRMGGTSPAIQRLGLAWAEPAFLLRRCTYRHEVTV